MTPQTGLKHPPYYMIESYAKMNGYNFMTLAASMDMHYRTLLRKINGNSDFKEQETRKLSTILKTSKDALFLTQNV